ncbi:MAG: hypothetical protein CMH22_12515 [Methylophaga sp.]|uniref:hypothetical protein n=1 Tax=Methylophaga sp. UBA678 TaxID=1946901 RepID=UPI000C667526|nr:hypothetical protein [Methylophaga sp. UBA678]MAX52795.1 hypothetical protein [Methylophaga sp.]
MMKVRTSLSTRSMIFSQCIVASMAVLPIQSVTAEENTVEQLQSRLKALQAELESTQAALAKAEQEKQLSNAKLEELSRAEPTLEPDNKIRFGHLKVGGAIRANYAIGDYPETGGASRSFDDGGNFALDTFRINLDYENGPYLGKLEYRWYNGYNFLHTGWLGYQFDENRQIQVGVNRVPFGPGPYGISQSWFFDQHYYLGLSDDMDLGVKYHQSTDNWDWDVAYYVSDEGSYTGSSHQSARYSYDVVNESGDGYEERNQFNLRGIRHFQHGEVGTDLGFSLQYSQLKSRGSQDDGHHYALSGHMLNKWQAFTLATQLTYYRFDVDRNQPLGTNKLVQMGAYDFPSTTAAEAWLPAISLSYRYDTDQLPWLDYVMPYVEYSVLLKQEHDFNDSALATVGAAWASGNWYIYTDLSASNGNEFIGGDDPFGDRLGANQNDDWQTRFNINFGYYF